MATTLLTQSRRSSSPSSGRAAIVALVVTTAVLAVLFARGREEALEPAPELTLKERYEADERIRYLIDPCPWPGPFAADTNDLPRVLASKLDAQSQREPMRRAMAALAAMGDDAKDALTELFEDAIRDRMRIPVAKNVLSVCANSTGTFGRELALTGLASPHEQVRRESAIVLMRHPAPGNYDVLEAAFPGLSTPGTLEHTLEAMLRADPARYVDFLVSEVERTRPEPGFPSPGTPLIDSLTVRVHDIEDQALSLRLAELARAEPWLPFRNRVKLLGPAARAGDEVALQELRDALARDRPQMRKRAADSLARCKLAHELYVLAATADASTERASAWALILEPDNRGELSEEQEADLVRFAKIALSDDEPNVRTAVIGPLLRAGDEEAQAQLLRWVTGSIAERGDATRAMRDALDGTPEFADRVRAALAAEWERELGASATPSVLRSILTALGAVPGEETGRFLLERARQIQRLNAENLAPGADAPLQPRMAVTQIFNAGPASRTVLLEALESETDPFLRLDLVYFAWQDFEDDSFDVLAGLVEDEARSSYERLYVADRMLRMKKPARLLPLLKRVYRTSTDPVLQPGLACLLWAWFGPPLED